MANMQQAGNVLDELLGLNPGDPGTPEKIWKVVSERFRDLKESGSVPGAPCVDLMFHTWEHNQTDGQVEIRYNSDNWDLEELRKDCEALEHLGFVVLAVHES